MEARISGCANAPDCAWCAVSYETDLIGHARELQRLLTKRRRLRRQLKEVESAVRHERKFLKALQQASEGRRPDIAPSHLTHGTTGLERIK